MINVYQTIKKYIFVFLFSGVFIIASEANADNFYSATSTTIARAKGMGGAYTAVLDGPASTLYNPAALGLYRFPRKSKMTVFLNPMGLAAIYQDREVLFKQREMENKDWGSLSGAFIKTIAFTGPSFAAVLNFAEQLPRFQPYQKQKYLSSVNLLDSNFNSLSLRLNLAKQISIGASGFLYNVKNFRNTLKEFGSSYGILIRPAENFTIGVAYFDYPKQIAPLMLAKNRTVDETINVGLSYKPASFVMFAADIRNVSEDQSPITREMHFGMELVPSSLIAFRTGYYQRKDDHRKIYSFGVGLLDSNVFHSTGNGFVFHDFVLNYGLEIEKVMDSIDYRHFMTLLIRL